MSASERRQVRNLVPDLLDLFEATVPMPEVKEATKRVPIETNKKKTKELKK